MNINIALSVTETVMAGGDEEPREESKLPHKLANKLYHVNSQSERTILGHLHLHVHMKGDKFRVFPVKNKKR